MVRLTYKTIVFLATALIATVTVAPAVAAGAPAKRPPLLDKNKFSIGAGIANNSVSRSANDELGFQFFGAYNITAINLMDGVNTSVELGYMDYGFDGSGNSGGIWGAMVVGGSIGGGFGWLARLGLDVGDDSGLMLGAGGGYSVNKEIELRVEYVVRDEIDSLQFNVLYRL